jgi:S-sulfosulfanyl-L-cysteine sulfohydrolase
MNSLHARLQRVSKRYGWKKVVLSATLLLSSLIGGTLLLTACDVGTPLQILWTNDTHGFFLPVYHAEYSEIDSYAQTAATEGKVGGYAQIAGLVKKLKEGPWARNTLFVDAGDTFDGSPVAQMTRGQAVIPVLNAMGYDAWTPGNRDFAWPKPDFLAVTSQLNFPMVCANLQDATTGEFVLPRYIIKQVGGLKVAMIGLTSLAGGGAGFQVLGGNVPGAPLETDISTLAATIRATENPDLVVVLSHLGYFQDQKFAANTTGIDVIVGAHTHHNVFTAPVVANADGSRDVIVVQAGSHGKFLGKLNLYVKNKKVVHFTNELIRVSTKNLEKMHVKPDPTVLALANQAYAPFQAMLDQVIGQTTTVLERRGDTQSTMTNFLNDAVAERYGVDGARFPGIRYGSSVIPGPITVGDVWNIVSPNFGGNVMSTYTLTGGAIMNTILSGLNTEYGADPYNWNGGDVTRFNDRIKYTFNVSAPMHLVDLSITTAAGVSVDLVKGGVNVPANLARVFTFAGPFPMPGAANVQPIPNVTAVDEIVAYIQSKGTISPKIDDRTVQLDTAPTNVSDIQ